MKLKIFLFITFSVLADFAFAQYDGLFDKMGESAFLDFQYHRGKPINYSDSLNLSLQNSFEAIDLRFGINSFGRSPQDFPLNFPNYGLGFTTYNLNATDTIGNPMGLYGFFSSPLIRNNEWTIGWELATGIAWHFNKFDIITNPKNDLIGSDVTVYFNLKALFTLLINERFDWTVGMDFTHFSNGSFTTPNKGLNLYGLDFGLRYHFQTIDKELEFRQFKRKLDGENYFNDPRKYVELASWLAFGAKKLVNKTYTGPAYLCGTFSADLNRAYGWIGKYGVGVDVIFDRSLRADFAKWDTLPEYTYSLYGVHLNHEFMVNKFSLAFQVGTYFYKFMPAKGNFFLRTGLKYNLTKNLFINLSLKSANGMVADYIELGGGYRFKLKE